MRLFGFRGSDRHARCFLLRWACGWYHQAHAGLSSRERRAPQAGPKRPHRGCHSGAGHSRVRAPVLQCRLVVQASITQTGCSSSSNAPRSLSDALMRTLQASCLHCPWEPISCANAHRRARRVPLTRHGTLMRIFTGSDLTHWRATRLQFYFLQLDPLGPRRVRLPRQRDGRERQQRGGGSRSAATFS